MNIFYELKTSVSPAVWHNVGYVNYGVLGRAFPKSKNPNIFISGKYHLRLEGPSHGMYLRYIRSDIGTIAIL